MSGTTARYSLTQGIPAVRIGWLVAEARSAAGFTQDDLASRTGVKRRLVKRWEKGSQIPNDDEIVGVARALEIGVGNLLPPRDTVEFDRVARSLRVGGAVVSITDVHNEAVLSTYVQLVRQQRGLGAEAPFVIRHEDVDALAGTLDLDDVELQQRLVAVVGLPPAEAAGIHARLLSRKRMSLPAGIVVGSLGLVAGSGQADAGLVAPPAAMAEAAPMPAAAVDRLDPIVSVTPVGEPAPWTTVTPPADEPAAAATPPLEIGDALRIVNPDAD